MKNKLIQFLVIHQIKQLKILVGTKDPKNIYSGKGKLSSNNIINSVLFSSKSKEWFALECPVGM